ncbi:MAG: energy transducer TonB [Bacteroidia bacterium]|nr:energy transducer TonB [Bacteroidia bacterium]
MYNSKKICMELKKNPRLEPGRYYGLFMELGLAMSLLLVITAFEWSFYDGMKPVDLAGIASEDIVLEDIPVIYETPPPPPEAVVSPDIVESEDAPENPEDALFEENEPIAYESGATLAPPVSDLAPEVKEVLKEPEILINPEQMPEPEGGFQAFYNYLGKNIRYPEQARRVSIEGKVFVQFVVDKNGQLTDFKILKGIGHGCDEEALRVLREAPKWNPGKQRGRPVRVRISLPIQFRLQ